MGGDIEPGEARAPLTLASIASRVGVSVNTVSRALRAPNTVRAELRREIAKAMEELNYVPNRLAGGLAGTRSDIVGVVVTSLYYSEFAAIIDTLQSSLLASNLQVMLANTRYDADQELKLVRSILSWRPAAVAIIGVDHHPKVSELLRASGVPIIEMWDIGGDIIDSAVGLDHQAVGAAQASHLIERGYKSLAFLGSVRENDARAQKRAKGMQQRVLAAGLQAVTMATKQESGHPDLGESLALDLLKRHPDIDGIVCNSDVIAFGVLRALAKIGKRVPEDIGVIGFGDSEASSCITPSLTTVRPDRENIGRLTAETALARINDGASRTVRVEWQLIERNSTRSV
ncbi:MAG: LacI family DNA-binding transcriptional regulator [Rhizobiaceae bacterium]|nr:LacI family DNA-binding transcriptional regulator [Rhizobiaceae bacterium]